MSSVTEEVSQICTFKLGRLLFGVAVLAVQEVVKDRPLTAVPQAPETVKGLLNLRGQILVAIDLRKRLLLPEASEDLPSKRLIIVRSGEGSVALLVDSVGEVFEVTSETFEQMPGNLPQTVRPFIVGVHNVGGQILHLMDAEKTSTLSSRNRL